jgi:hypothetical protein
MGRLKAKGPNPISKKGDSDEVGGDEIVGKLSITLRESGKFSLELPRDPNLAVEMLKILVGELAAPHIRAMLKKSEQRDSKIVAPTGSIRRAVERTRQ